MATQQPWLDVPFAEKDEAKAAGAQWDRRARRWYAPRPGMPELARWLPRPRTPGDAEHAPRTGHQVSTGPNPETPTVAPSQPAQAQNSEESAGPAAGGPHLPAWEDLARRPPGLNITQEATRRRAAGESDTSWRAGSDGEARLAAALAGLTHPGRWAQTERAVTGTARWRVLHSVPLGPDGRRGDIDHVLIGPPGVITINTKHHQARRRVDVTDTITVGGRSTDYVAKARREADRAAALLTAAAADAALGSPTEAWPFTADEVAVVATVAAGRHPRGGPSRWPPVTPVIAVVGAPLHGRDRPAGVLVVTPKTLPRLLSALPTALDEHQAVTLHTLARRSTTWSRDL